MGWLGLGQDSVDVCAADDLSGACQMTGPAPTAAQLAASGVSTAAVCPAGSTCSIVPGISNTTIYLAVGAVAFGFVFMGMKK